MRTNKYATLPAAGDIEVISARNLGVSVDSLNTRLSEDLGRPGRRLLNPVKRHKTNCEPWAT